MKPTTTVTYSRSSPALIKCQVFYSKDTEDWRCVNRRLHVCDVIDVSGQGNTNACEGMKSISFEQRTLKSRGDYERKALWSRGGVSRTLVFNPVPSMRAYMSDMYTTGCCGGLDIFVRNRICGFGGHFGVGGSGLFLTFWRSLGGSPGGQDVFKKTRF